MQGRGLLSRMHCPVSVDSTLQAHLPVCSQEEELRGLGGTSMLAGARPIPGVRVHGRGG